MYEHERNNTKRDPFLVEANKRKQILYLIKQQFNEALFWFIYRKFYEHPKQTYHIRPLFK